MAQAPVQGYSGHALPERLREGDAGEAPEACASAKASATRGRRLREGGALYVRYDLKRGVNIVTQLFPYF